MRSLSSRSGRTWYGRSACRSRALIDPRHTPTIVGGSRSHHKSLAQAKDEQSPKAAAAARTRLSSPSRSALSLLLPLLFFLDCRWRGCLRSGGLLNAQYRLGAATGSSSRSANTYELSNFVRLFPAVLMVFTRAAGFEAGSPGEQPRRPGTASDLLQESPRNQLPGHLLAGGLGFAFAAQLLCCASSCRPASSGPRSCATLKFDDHDFAVRRGSQRKPTHRRKSLRQGSASANPRTRNEHAGDRS